MQISRGTEGFVHKLLDVLFVNPGRAQTNLDLRSVQVFGLGGGKGFYIDCKGRVIFSRPLCLPQLPAHIAGQILVGGHIMGRSILLQLPRYAEDHALQFACKFFRGLAGQFRHVRHIHTGFFRDGHSQGFTCRIHSGNSFMGFYGTLGEHIRLAFQLAVLIQHFQSAEQVVAGIIGQCQPVPPVVDKAILCRKAVIEPVQFCLLSFDFRIGSSSVHLKVNQFLHTVPQPHQSFDTFFGGGV